MNVLDEYMAFTDTVAVYPHAGDQDLQALTYVALGLAGETGETIDHIKKLVRDGSFMHYNKEALTYEVGDVFFYLIRLCKELGIDPLEALEKNQEKLSGRKASGTLKRR